MNITSTLTSDQDQLYHRCLLLERELATTKEALACTVHDAASRLHKLELTIEHHETLFDTIGDILQKSQLVYEALQNGRV